MFDHAILFRKSLLLAAVFGLMIGTVGSVSLAQEEATATKEATATEATPPAEATKPEAPAESASVLAFAFDNFALFICAVLVLFMQAGFGMLEAGLNTAKSTVNILCKNLMDLCVGVLLFFFVGYGLMYPGYEEGDNKYINFGAPMISAFDGEPGPGVLLPQVDFLFQVAFAATAATIVSGAVAGRMKFGSYLIYSAFLTGLIYPISGYWKWGGGWLDQLGFYDFAGSIVVHAVGGFAGLAGAIVLGPRLGRFVDGKSNPIPGHNLTFAALGVFILWVGWYGFNPGSQLAFSSVADIEAVVMIATNTTLAPAAGGIVCMLIAWLIYGKPDLTMGLNGALGGLVGITANCDSVTNLEAIAIGGVAGAVVLFGVLLLEKLKIDDPVGAFPVHGLAGIWGGIATGIFGDYALGIQVLGSLVIPLWAFSTMFILFAVLKAIGFLRVSATDEEIGLDISEHGMRAYGPGTVSAGGQN
ncbi:MAG: ammonium transporter [Pirellulaceae bacterium]|nr:ammonium transporter [Pirellulaceae bacterium]